ncbi:MULTISPECIES: succinate dehydrogenase cytochrome b subunit [Flavobacterium]|uniref:Succinate dehydrogenase cytochrome b subunit n=2 Tax=Flavobacterium TaxID=237 RepID=A0AA94F188_9FLAO|nr:MULTISPECIES: succinate dehydrogenase cytochrome b subunit [Flavobacterium]OXA83349.1 succinate dehydrogenase [Flavobacterium columnare] [Flavobacterium columnare NBRC 100251 = ATCC 23463]AMA50465.1 succinate dehydrogenase [Flavobacterium covae]AND64012.1 succinate dehydrogenase [Flavobacterium covae]MCH4829523.1 succinate dehydrogenase cytochrome b subunit [Flavobacterium columnare]MCH4831480.1 succinate dehydrogenase cytochrome b subunit [Flavobacterium columnare]
MAKSALLKSSIAKKYWMALTGLFLCLFLAGHLAGNLQLIFGDALQFNQYALFMTTNPAVKLLSYVTYFSILFHAVDGIMLTIQNKKARPVAYAMSNPQNSSSLASRNMAVLGTLILVFIITHMANFWAKMHFSEMPLQTITVEQMGQKADYIIGTQAGQFFPADKMLLEQQGMEIKNGKDIYNKMANIKVGEGYKDLHKITIEFFKNPSFGLIATILYVLAMAVLAFHLLHGFQSAFQSLGVNNGFTPAIKTFGKLFAIIVPLLFAIIPVYIHFVK